MDNNTLETLRAVYLTAEDLRVAASILYNAYHDDPYFIEVLGQDDNQQYEQKLRAAIREELNEQWQQEQPLMQKETCILEHLPSQKCGVLQFIALSPNEQQKGYGAKLIQAVLSWCDEQPGLDGIGVFVSNSSHHQAFVKQEFVSIATVSIGNIEGEILFYSKA